jgi:predicted ArsR family transcriptional regulator
MDLDELGHNLFGRRLRLRVALWVQNAPSDVFSLSEAADGVGYSPSGVRQELDRLERLGMIDRYPYSGVGRAYYGRSQSPLWRVVAAAEAALAEIQERDRMTPPQSELTSEARTADEGTWGP